MSKRKKFPKLSDEQIKDLIEGARMAQAGEAAREFIKRVHAELISRTWVRAKVPRVVAKQSRGKNRKTQ
jgi:hypothetical protein